MVSKRHVVSLIIFKSASVRLDELDGISDQLKAASLESLVCLGMFFECIDEPMTEFDRHRLVKRKSSFFGQDDIDESYLTESGNKVSCCFKIFEVWRDN